MPDGNTGPDAAQKLVEKNEEIEKLKEKLEKESGRVLGAEKKFTEWAAEIGEVRKQKDELVTALADAKKILADLKVAPAPVVGHKQDETQVEDPDTVEKQLTEDQRKVVEEGFNSLSPVEKQRYESDPKFRLVFLKRSQDAAPVIPSSPWKTAKQAKKTNEGAGYDDILDRVFKKKQQSSFVPPGSSGGITRMVDGKPASYDPPEDTRVR